MTDMPPIFVADSPGLDFLNSVATPVDTRIEWLGSGTDFLSWMNQAHLVPENVAAEFERNAVPGELDAVASQARALREWFRGFVYDHKGRPLTAQAVGDLDPLNRILSRDEAFGQIGVGEHNRDHDEAPDHHAGPALVWQPDRRWRSPESLLLPLARSLADLLIQDDFTHVKACEGQACTLLFVDRTRSHARRWCSMAMCGNRAKQAAFRDRTRLQAGPGHA